MNSNRALPARLALEIELQRKLNSTRRTCECRKAISGRSQLRSGILCDSIRIGEFRIRMVPGIEELRAEFYPLLFANGKRLKK